MAASHCEGEMTLTGQTIFIISADSAVAQECINELTALGCHCQMQMASSIEEAHREFRRTPPAVVFLDESSVDSVQGESLESAIALLTEEAPVVVVAAPEKQADLAFLITSGAVDFVTRTGRFAPIAAGLLDRRVRMSKRVGVLIQFPNEELAGDFGEILRHEVNNPLTGILGNTELLLARSDRLPPSAVERLQTIAELAVRLRETVRRLSNAWEEHYEHAGRA
jgi:signal transduction histidine kinase